MSQVNLRRLVLDEIEAIGPKEAAKFFGVSGGTISNWLSGKTEPSITAAQLVWDKNGMGLVGPHEEEPITQWEGKDVIILTPVYRSFNPKTHYTLFANYARYGVDKIGLEQKERTVIHESRNILVDKWLKNTKAPTALMVDDDMILPCGSSTLLNGRYNAKLPNNLASQIAVSRIMSHPHDKGIVGGLYFGRSEKGHAQCASAFSSLAENRKWHELGYSGLKPEDWVATGFLRLERWVFEKMRAEIDNGRWPECKPTKEDSWYGYFNPLRVRVGEDVSFGRRAAEIGIQSYVDASLVCGHADGNYIYWHHNTRAE